MALNDIQKKHFEEVLKVRKEELQGELSTFTKKDERSAEENFISDFPDIGDKEDENAQEVAEYEKRLSQESVLEKELRDIRSSLQKIEEGTYGTCKYCGNDIKEGRLEIRPTSSSCVACKKNFKGEV
jgi:RNA polymerase-binding protein DksA